ncbi:MAG: hypothetical protein Kow00121_65200 [Elainellaceae cyanobacterium]
MLISDLEQLEFLSESKSVIGGSAEEIQLLLHNDLIQLKLGNQPALNQKLTNGKPLVSKFSLGEVTGLLTAVQKQDANGFSQSVSLTGKDDTSTFSFSSSTLVVS